MGLPEEQPTYGFGVFRLDAQHRLLRRSSGEAIQLAPKAFDVLLYLVERPGQLIGKRELLEAVWPHVIVEENNLNQCISALRRALGERPGEHRFIATDPGRGYRFVAPVEAIAQAAGAETAIETRTILADGETETLDEEAPAPSTATTAATRPAASLSRLLRGRAGAGSLVALTLILAGGWYWGMRDGSEPTPPSREAARPRAQTESLALPNSVAVLPLEVIGSDPSGIADGLHIELIAKLSQAGLNVKTRAAVLQYAGGPLSFATIANEQQVESILVGSIQQAGEQIRVSVNLVDPAGFTLWSSPPYSTLPVDVFRLQADIATNVAEALRLEISASNRQRMSARPTSSLDAQVAYWQALAAAGAGVAIAEPGARTVALSLLERAIDDDPDFAAAHAQLALLYARSVIDWISDAAPPLAPEEAYRRTQQHAELALRLDDGQAAANVALAEANVYFWRWTEAAKDFEAAFRLNPRDRDTLTLYSQFDSIRGEFDTALDLAERVRALDGEFLYPTWLRHTYSGDVDAAVEILERQLAIDERQIAGRLNLGFVNVRKGRRDEATTAFRIVERLLGNALTAGAAAGLAWGYSLVGEGDTARRLLDTLPEGSDGSIGEGARAQAHLAAGNRDEAIAALERAIDRIRNHEPDQAWFSLMAIKHNVAGDPVLDTAPFVDLRRRITGD